MLAVPFVLYTFGAIHWTVEELRQLDTKTRKRMNMERSLHPKSSFLRIYLPRHLVGGGLLSLERLYNRVVLATACYVTRSTDLLIGFVREHEKAGKGAFLFEAAIRAAEELSLAIDFTRRCQQSITELAPPQLKTHIKAAEVEFLLKLHKDKPMHGIFYKHLEEHGLSQQLTFSFLRSSGLKSETEGFIMACQDDEEEKRTKYQEHLGQLRRLWPDYAVSLLVMVIGSLGGMRNTLLSALREMPVCRAAAHILATRMQKAVILGSLQLENAATKIQATFRGHLTRKHEAEKKGEPESSSAKGEVGKSEEEELDIDLTDPDLNKAAVKIQASFRGHMVRKENEDEQEQNAAVSK
nr:unnamed protein product [Callosobruchus chinensis]